MARACHGGRAHLTCHPPNPIFQAGPPLTKAVHFFGRRDTLSRDSLYRDKVSRLPSPVAQAPLLVHYPNLQTRGLAVLKGVARVSLLAILPVSLDIKWNVPGSP